MASAPGSRRVNGILNAEYGRRGLIEPFTFWLNRRRYSTRIDVLAISSRSIDAVASVILATCRSGFAIVLADVTIDKKSGPFGSRLPSPLSYRPLTFASRHR